MLSPVTAATLGLKEREIRFLRFGLLCCTVNITTASELKPQEVILSQNIVDCLRLPLSMSYELTICESQLLIGPYIGILAAKSDSRLHNSIQSLSNYMHNYQAIGGAILAFSLDGVDVVNQQITGYMFNPSTKDWVAGTYGYPAAIMQRIRTNSYWRSHFQAKLGNRVFNNYVFNKWEMYQWLQAIPALQPYLPETALYQGPRSILPFIERHGRIYIKPITGSQGAGVVSAEGRSKCVILRYNLGGQPQETICETRRQLVSILRPLLGTSRCIVQQGLDLIRSEDRIIDFRLILAKNQARVWEDFGLIARYGPPCSVVSNISSGGKAVSGEQALRDLQLTEQAVFNVRQVMRALALTASTQLETCGIHCGNLGIDLGLDQTGKIWLIEINNRDPNHTIALDIGDRQMFYRIKQANMLYAKSLAGFVEEL
jgi:glutathione synthase/RimK-type ligase-like ATP-grasp enzyme